MVSNLIGVGRNRFGHPAANLNTDGAGKQQIFAADIARLAKRQSCGERGSGRVNANAMSGSRPTGELNAVEIERVSRGGVGERRRSRTALEAGANPDVVGLVDVSELQFQN